MGSNLLFRYLENTLGLTRVSRDFFAAEASDQPMQSLPVEPRRRRCFLVYAETLDKPSLVEMANKLKQAVETEFSKLGMANDVEVLWWNLREQAGRPDGNILLCLDFGSDFRETVQPGQTHGVVRLPRLQEIHENPLAKREAWKQIQMGIGESANSTLV